MNKKKSFLVFWILFFIFNPIGFHAFYVGRMKDFYIRLVINISILIVTIGVIIVSLVIGDFHWSLIDNTSYNFQYKLKTSNIFFTMFCIVFFVGISFLVALAIIDFFRIILGKYVPKDFQSM